MKKEYQVHRLLLITTILAISASFTLAEGNLSTFKPGKAWPDDKGVHINAHGGGILYHEGLYYWFGEYAVLKTRAEGYPHQGVRVYTSTDLYNWTDAGMALTVSDDTSSKIAQDCIISRPKVIYNAKTEKFVMWFHHEILDGLQGYRTAASGVALSDSPLGPYRYIGSERPNAGAYPLNVPDELKRPLGVKERSRLAGMKLTGGALPYYPKQDVFRRDAEGGQMARDMNLFVDDDGTAYHIYASEENGTLHISKLSDDYTKSIGHYVRLFPGRFHEAPAMMKVQGRYFVFASGCSSWAPNTARLCFADSILGEWEEVGNPCVDSSPTTYNSQSTFILPVQGKQDAFIFMADRWDTGNFIDSRYVWLPIQFRHGFPMIEWMSEWDLNIFEEQNAEQIDDS